VLDSSRWNRGHLDVAIGMISSSSLREHLWFEHAGALRRETSRAGCALIKRPHLSAVSFLKSVAGLLAGTVIAVQPFASSEEAELWGPAKDLSSEPSGAKHGGPPRLSMDAFCVNDLRRFSPKLRESGTPARASICDGSDRARIATAGVPHRFDLSQRDLAARLAARRSRPRIL